MSGDGQYITVQDKQNIANGYFEKCKKKLAKWDEKLAAGKKVSSDDAMYAANYYILGYKKICNQDYAKVLEYIKLCPQIPFTKMYTVALQYQLNKDKAAAKAAMDFMDKPSAQLSHIASLFGLADVYHEKLMSMVADKKQAIRRAVRSRDLEALISYIPYDIPEVDSIFGSTYTGIAIARHVSNNGNSFSTRSIDEVEDFDDRNVIKIITKDDDKRIWAEEYEKGVIDDYFVKKCVYIHEMPWTLTSRYSNIKRIAESYPKKLQLLAFNVKSEDKNYYWIQDIINTYCLNCDKSSRKIDDADNHLLDFIKSFRNDLASFAIAVMAQVYGQIGRNPYGFNDRYVFSSNLKMELYNITKELIERNPCLQDNSSLPVTISGNGKVTIKDSFGNPSDDYDTLAKQIAEKIYHPLVNYIWAKYKQQQ